MMNDRKTTLSAIVSHRHELFAGALSLGILLSSGAFAIDGPPRQSDAGQAPRQLSLTPIPYLETMRSMKWTPNAPALKVDTLLVPDAQQPGLLRSPIENESVSMRVS
jgi:hypothetical protein